MRRFARIGIVCLVGFLLAHQGWVAFAEEPVVAKAADQITLLRGTVTDASGRPVSGATVGFKIGLIDEKSRQTQTDADGRYEFKGKTKPIGMAFSGYVTVEHEGEMAFVRIGVMEESSARKPNEVVNLQLSPIQTQTIRVIDASGQPIKNARAIVRTDQWMPYHMEQSDEDGIATFRLPSDQAIVEAIALESGHGFAAKRFAAPEKQGEPNPRGGVAKTKFDSSGETLTLEGSRNITLRVVDGQDNPVAGVSVYPWLLQPPGQVDQVNLSMFNAFIKEKSNENGIVEFGWIPTWQSRGMTFWAQSDGYTQSRILVTPDDRPNADGLNGTIPVDRLVRLSGRIVDASGSPVPECEVLIRGARQERHDRDVTTNSAGEYEAFVAPNMAYLITGKVTEDDRVTAVTDSMTGFAVLPEQPHRANDLVLRTPTRVTGVVRDQDGNPAVKERLTIYHSGVEWRKLDDSITSGVPEGRHSQPPILFLNPTTDAEGRYEVSLGDGEYSIRPPGQRSAENVTIQGETELEVDLKWERELPPTDRFTGTVKYPDGRPAVNAMVKATVDGIGRGWDVRTNEEGAFSTLEKRATKTLLIESADRTFGLLLPVASQKEFIEIVVQPVGQATITVVDADGNPMPETPVELSMTMHRNSRGGFTSRPLPKRSTDAEGRVTFDGLIPGAMHTLSPKRETPFGGTPILAQFRVQPGEQYETSVAYRAATPRQERKPYEPPSNATRLESFLSSKLSMEQRLKWAIDTADVMSTQILFVIGSKTSGELEDWVGIRYDNRDYGKASTDFTTLALDLDENRDEVVQWLTSLDISQPAEDFFGIVILDKKGGLLEAVWRDELFVDGELDAGRMTEVLRRYPLELPSAETAIKEALKIAQRDQKRVIVQESATWCGPCHKLTRFLRRNPVWEKDYVYVKMDHRMDGAFEWMKELRDGSQGGIPWFAILDADGNKLATSNSTRTDQNIGYPSSEAGQEHFAEMLRQTATRMTDQEIESLIDQLREK